ncbi:hypothetical protein [Falsochrobactrum ovis]|uniref:hypothetical protein n=1 Tax=Falsochrobactrum ovis TaxID=1293442 RepID=UPI001313E147|nr:hypothetical protein [Falsochrobactrum ovis]
MTTTLAFIRRSFWAMFWWVTLAAVVIGPPIMFMAETPTMPTIATVPINMATMFPFLPPNVRIIALDLFQHGD